MMRCIGKKCEIREQKARNVMLTKWTSSTGCLHAPNVSDITEGLRDKSVQMVLEKANVTAAESGSDCKAPCICSPQKYAVPIETDWTRVPFDPVIATEGECTVTIEGTVEIKVINTPGLCKAGKITAASIGFIPEQGLVISSFEKEITSELLSKIDKGLA